MSMVNAPIFKGVPRPRIYNWVGSSAKTLYWDDPNNWAEHEYPNHPETTAIFAGNLKSDVHIILRKEILLANTWFSEKEHSYTIAPSGDLGAC